MDSRTIDLPQERRAIRQAFRDKPRGIPELGKVATELPAGHHHPGFRTVPSLQVIMQALKGSAFNL